ncbi:undecaprenyldiphospho-muramoylpentapeptide beta-N-acetylglucosaminyltransferase [Bacillus sp. CECT 9360]|uniref:undecaprenyldiphospho-muramoylpentapeptide beta-N-acetylglucosaminyltransferase n=1 Tax=Bacillus sp. CECT 9360 TaxID=2845821 RepID=UPI001E6283C3|nr:undecaprenyldiphospho-muramoylpentapeptide beta-N-acetylglucosaminyltransferase [Bacillus sp. CECT 9360]CAH0346893.1 UDP-N-acetylglucosamine--N-acetylmuramyl-(pentapeptide) pyrophosphoryl-undecaprenol N-acetylglucosamine transferase [Bacillus sp. CECT 9360]
MKIVVSGGGTGGHIYPALALIREIKNKDKNSSFLYIGTENGLEKDIVTSEQIPFKSIHITGFKRKLSFENVKTVTRFLKGVRDSKKMLKEFKADVVIGTGGYVCGPVVYAAAKLGIPCIVHEQNSIPGLTNKFLSKYVDKVAICFNEAKQFFPENKTVLTGNPRASEVLHFEGKAGLKKLGLNPSIPTVLIFGGSRGARPINEAVLKVMSELRGKSYQVLYVTGEVHFDQISREIELIGNPENVMIKPYLSNMPEILSGVDLAVTRAGATTLAELTVLGIPSILIPSPYVTNNHQERNARSLSDHGAAELVLEKELNGSKLISTIDSIITDKKKLESMKQAAIDLGLPDAADRLYQVIMDIAKKN